MSCTRGMLGFTSSMMVEIEGELAALERTGDALEMARAVRHFGQEQPRIFALPSVKAWCGRRWRHLFLCEAVTDQLALEVATRAGDRRSARQRIAERYLARDVEAWRDEQPDAIVPTPCKTSLLFCSGLASGLLRYREFRDELGVIRDRFSMRVLRSDSHPGRGCAANARDIMAALEDGVGRDAEGELLPAGISGEGLSEAMVLAFSKGAPDVLTTLVLHPEVKGRIRCVVTWGGAIGGSPLADDVSRKYNAIAIGRAGDTLGAFLKQSGRYLLPPWSRLRYRLSEYDLVSAVRDLKTSVREAFLAQHGEEIDRLSIPIFTVRGVAALSDVPLSRRRGHKLIARYEAESDMQVGASCSQLDLPMATELAVIKGHHWDIAYPSFRTRRWLNKTFHPFPRAAALVATVTLASELGLVR